MSAEKKILKLTFEPEAGTKIVAFPADGQVLHAAFQVRWLSIWYLGEPWKNNGMATFYFVETGKPCPDARYLTTLLLENGAYVLHVFYKIEGQQ